MSKGDKDRTRNFKAYRESPFWSRKDRSGVKSQICKPRECETALKLIKETSDTEAGRE